MRITSGKARGIILKSPKGGATRPATDAARQAVFSSISDFVEGANALDLFAGTGSYGLEALSRGAKSAVFVENSRLAASCLKENLSALERSMGKIIARTVFADCFSLKADFFQEPFNLIFADAPYPLLMKKSSEVFDLLLRFSTPETLVMLEAPAEFEPPETSAFKVLKRLGKNSKGKPSQLLMRRI